MSRKPATNQANNPESLLRNDLEDFSRDLLGLHTRFQNMFPVLASSRDSAATATAASASATGAAQSMATVPGHLRDLAARGFAAIPPSPALTPSQPKADPNLTISLERRICYEIETKMKEELTKLKGRLDAQQEKHDQIVQEVDIFIYRAYIQSLEARMKQVQDEMDEMREEKFKRQQAEEKFREDNSKMQEAEGKMREELWKVIRKMQGDIEELKKGRAQESVKEDVSQQKKRPKHQDIAIFEEELISRRLWELVSEGQNGQSDTSSALVPFSSPAEKDTNAFNTAKTSQSGTSVSVVSGLDLTTRPANRGRQSVTSVPGTERKPDSAGSEGPVPALKSHPRKDHDGLALLSDTLPRVLDQLPALWGSDDDGDGVPTARRARFGKEDYTTTGRRLGRLSQGTAPTSTSRSRSPRPSLDTNFRVRDSCSESIPKSNSCPTFRRSNSSSSDESIPNDNEHNLSSQSIPSRFQPSRRTKSANELIDKHLSFIPNGWRTILANTAKQLSSEDWDRSDAVVLKKLEEYCPSFKGLEEILPNFRMAVPALRDLIRDLERHP